MAQLLLIAGIHEGWVLKSAGAEPLDAVLEAADKVKLGRPSRDSRAALPSSVDPESSYGRIFVEPDVKNQIFLWLGDPPEHFSGGKVRTREKKELVGASRTFLSPRKVEVAVKVLIPHPAYISMVQFNLLKDFAQHLPPPSRIDSTEKMDFKGFPGTLYRLKEGGCSVVIRMIKEAMVVLQVADCENSRELVEVARGLDLKRLDAKLSS